MQRWNWKIEAPSCKFAHTWVIKKLRDSENLTYIYYFATECCKFFHLNNFQFSTNRFLHFQCTCLCFCQKAGSKIGRCPGNCKIVKYFDFAYYKNKVACFENQSSTENLCCECEFWRKSKKIIQPNSWNSFLWYRLPSKNIKYKMCQSLSFCVN